MSQENIESMSDEEIRKHLLKVEKSREENSGEPGRWDGVADVVLGAMILLGGIGLIVVGLATGFIVYFAGGFIISGSSLLGRGLRKRMNATWLK